MKKIIASLLLVSAVISKANAQMPIAIPQDKIQMSKEDKEKMKLKQEEDLAAAFKQADLTSDQEKQVREVMELSKQKNSLIKKDDTLKDAEKEAKLKAANDEKNAKIKEIMGADKYSIYNAAKKKQKEEAAAAASVKSN